MNRLAIVKLVLPVAAVLCAHPAAGQAHARFTMELTPREQIQGLTAAQARDWNETVTRVVDLLRANPAVHTPPDGICTKLYAFVPEFIGAERMSSTVTVQIPPSYDETRGCAPVSNEGVTVHLNNTGRFLHRNLSEEMSAADWERIYVMPAAGEAMGAALVYRDGYTRWAVLTHGREPLTRPISQQDYLQRRIAEWEQAGAADFVAQLQPRLDALTPAELTAPACFDQNDPIATMSGCVGGLRPYVMLNRAYFDATLAPNTVQLIVLTSPEEKRGKETPGHFALRTRIFESIDYTVLAELLRR